MACYVIPEENNLRNILVDIDGVVAQYNFPKILKEHFGVEVSNLDVQLYSLEDCLGLPSKQVMDMFSIVAFEPPNLIRDSISSLRKLIVEDWNVCIYSNRVHFMGKKGLEDWLSKYGIPYSVVLNGDSLPSYVSIAVDDYPSKLLKLSEDTTVRKLLLFSQPWNDGCLDLLNMFTRVNNWAEVMEEI
uniref:5' nucleotidase n=1 Tax=viral metagenome TaxID=1070528 RepID=A0A6H1ZZT6_9ZZZZ